MPAQGPDAKAAAITSGLLDWYDRSRRALPWRALPGERADPYRVWLSEIMLQQTTVAAVKPFFARFLELWPTVQTLAEAPREEVLRAWAGLGYYARARNLHDCARAVMERFDGLFPSTEAELRSLPGIGEYTGAAIASIAFARIATVVDGNVERVVSRLYAIEVPLPNSKPLIRQHTSGLVSPARPGDFAQATMDLGATLCTPKSPACGICPVRPHCAAQAQGLEREIPRKVPKTTRPQRFGASAVVERPDGAILVRTRPDSGLLGGMTEFFGTDWTEDAPDPAVLRSIADLSIEFKGTVDHVFTHFALRLDVYAAKSSGQMTPGSCRWVRPGDMDREPIPNLMTKVREVASNALVLPVLVGVDPDGLGLIGLEGADQQHGRKRKDRQA